MAASNPAIPLQPIPNNSHGQINGQNSAHGPVPAPSTIAVQATPTTTAIANVAPNPTVSAPPAGTLPPTPTSPVTPSTSSNLPPSTSSRPKRILSWETCNNYAVMIGVLIAAFGVYFIIEGYKFEIWTGRNDALQNCLAMQPLGNSSQYCSQLITEGVRPPPVSRRALAYVIETHKDVFTTAYKLTATMVVTITLGILTFIWSHPRTRLPIRQMVSMARSVWGQIIHITTTIYRHPVFKDPSEIPEQYGQVCETLPEWFPVPGDELDEHPMSDTPPDCGVLENPYPDSQIYSKPDDDDDDVWGVSSLSLREESEENSPMQASPLQAGRSETFELDLADIGSGPQALEARLNLAKRVAEVVHTGLRNKERLSLIFSMDQTRLPGTILRLTILRSYWPSPADNYGVIHDLGLLLLKLRLRIPVEGWLLKNPKSENYTDQALEPVGLAYRGFMRWCLQESSNMRRHLQKSSKLSSSGEYTALLLEFGHQLAKFSNSPLDEERYRSPEKKELVPGGSAHWDKINISRPTIAEMREAVEAISDLGVRRPSNPFLTSRKNGAGHYSVR